ncbi:RHS repeat-associated core domain-containing protein [Natronoglycomyces albus]|uniref:RHS repeat-associated core domain-containing protein n=1 Tax=Natronoglycomyces albus TaxID=2811108 RepID=A0A895XGU1_9ACTN|nr:RHS repeat-associated core domain-containing protein [Natronoglycomyces albus]QSB05071.1 RHS repeat-associated core domain-containing protein [Natronoglycomyces albus]
MSAVRTYAHNGTTIATRSTSEGVTWIGADHHGTAMWALAAGSLAVTFRRQDPFGNTRGEGGEDWKATQRGFHTGIEDPTGLVQMGARSYGPLTGRFISRDPVANFLDSQQINGYNYSNNNPISFSDASGLSPYGWVLDDFHFAPFEPMGEPHGNEWLYPQATGLDTQYFLLDERHIIIADVIDYEWCNWNKTACSQSMGANGQYQNNSGQMTVRVTIKSIDYANSVSTIGPNGLVIYDVEQRIEDIQRAAAQYAEQLAQCNRSLLHQSIQSTSCGVSGTGVDFSLSRAFEYAGVAIDAYEKFDNNQFFARAAGALTVLSEAAGAYDNIKNDRMSKKAAATVFWEEQVERS